MRNSVAQSIMAFLVPRMRDLCTHHNGAAARYRGSIAAHRYTAAIVIVTPVFADFVSGNRHAPLDPAAAALPCSGYACRLRQQRPLGAGTAQAAAGESFHRGSNSTRCENRGACVWQQ
jgi:hypothetical protein